MSDWWDRARANQDARDEQYWRDASERQELEHMKRMLDIERERYALECKKQDRERGNPDGKKGVDNESCFIATAAYGTPLAEEIYVLRKWRDNFLLTKPIGILSVKNYYKLSPAIAEYISTKKTARLVIRIMLTPLVKFLSYIYTSKEQ